MRVIRSTCEGLASSDALTLGITMRTWETRPGCASMGRRCMYQPEELGAIEGRGDVEEIGYQCCHEQQEAANECKHKTLATVVNQSPALSQYVDDLGTSMNKLCTHALAHVVAGGGDLTAERGVSEERARVEEREVSCCATSDSHSAKVCFQSDHNTNMKRPLQRDSFLQ